MKSFTARLLKFGDADLWHYHFNIPESISSGLMEGGHRRVLCSIKDGAAFACAIMFGPDGRCFINVNKEIRMKLGLKEGDEFPVMIRRDESEYGLPFPESFREVLDSDPEAGAYFEKLTPGKKRNLLYIIGKYKQIETQVRKSLVIAAHLKKQRGSIDFKQLNQDFKETNGSV